MLLFVFIFLLDYKTAKITAMDKDCDSNWFVALLCIETKVRVSLRERFAWHSDMSKLRM